MQCCVDYGTVINYVILVESVDAVFTSGQARLTDLSKEAMLQVLLYITVLYCNLHYLLQAIKDQDLRFLTVNTYIFSSSCSVH